MGKTIGGPSTPVTIITDQDLVENGGNFDLASSVVYAAEIVEGGRVTGDPVKPVYIITTSDLETNNYNLVGGVKLRITDVTLTEARSLEGKEALLIYIEGQDIYEESKPTGGTTNEGTVVGGGFIATKRCDDKSSWIIEETANGLDVRFTFSAQGGTGKKVKIRGKSSKTQNYTIQAYNGSAWETVDTENIITVDNTYTIILDNKYTISDTVQVRVYTEVGNSAKLYLDCLTLVSTASLDYMLLETGDYLLKEDGNRLILA